MSLNKLMMSIPIVRGYLEYYSSTKIEFVDLSIQVILTALIEVASTVIKLLDFNASSSTRLKPRNVKENFPAFFWVIFE